MAIDFDPLLQNISDCSEEATGVLTGLTALIVAASAFGENAYPYIEKIIDSASEMFSALGDGYENIVQWLESLKILIQQKLAENGFVTTGDIDEYFESIAAMVKEQEAAEAEIEAMDSEN